MRTRLFVSRLGITLAGALLLALGGCMDREPTAPTPVPESPQALLVPGPGFTQVEAGAYHSCAVVGTGTITCWGYNGYNQAPSTRSAASGLRFEQVSSRDSHTCALRSDRLVECWGWNHFGQATGGFIGSIQVSAGVYHTCALRSDGVTCWGYNGQGQVGGPPSGYYPYLANHPGSFAQVSSGGLHTCALRSDGVVACWGHNGSGQAPPTRVATNGTFAQVSSGSYHTCALRNDGVIECWGNNSNDQAPPTRVATNGTFAQVSSGTHHTCALQSDGVVECWGSNAYGQAPSTRSAMSGTFTQVSGGVHHTCALRSDGLVECWGENGSGQANPPSPPSTRVIPGATLITPDEVPEGSAIELALDGAHVPGHPEATSFTYAFNCGSGYGAFAGTNTASCATADGPAQRGVKGTVRDQDGDTREYTATVQVTNVVPTITTLSAPASVTLSGGSARAAVSLTFSDPAGAADAPYVATIDCGNGGSITGTEGTCTYTAVGTYSVTGRVVDKDGGIGTRNATVRVVYAFTGFFPPVANPPVFNVMNAGRAVPVKFGLDGDQGLQIFAAGYPRVVTVACPNGAPTNDVGETVPAGANSLSYDPVADQYNYVWNTERGWAGRCRQLVLRFADGNEQRANFQLR
jgi:alpha-tubulin suppressor-like RCC1 family protein